MSRSSIISFGSPESLSPKSPRGSKSPTSANAAESANLIPISTLPSASWQPASPAAASDAQDVQSDRLLVPSQFKGKFTDSQIISFQEVFTFYDKDGSGNIDRDELACVLQTLGEDVTDAKLDEMLSEVDQDGDGEVSWAEFLHVMTLSKVSLFKSVTERLDKKLNPLKVGDDVVMSQGGVRVHVVLKRQAGMFWTVKPVGGGSLIHNVLPSCLTRGLIDIDLKVTDAATGGDMVHSSPPQIPPSSLPSGNAYGPAKPAFVPSEDNSILFSSSHFMHSIITSQDGRRRRRSELPDDFRMKSSEEKSPVTSDSQSLSFEQDEKSSNSSPHDQYVENRLSRALRYKSNSFSSPNAASSEDSGSPFVNPDKKKVLSSLFPGSSIECHPNGKVVITPVLSPISPASNLPSPKEEGEEDNRKIHESQSMAEERGGVRVGDTLKDSGLRDLVERLSLRHSIHKSSNTASDDATVTIPQPNIIMTSLTPSRSLRTASPLPEDNDEPPTAPERREAAARGRFIIAEQMEKNKEKAEIDEVSAPNNQDNDIVAAAAVLHTVVEADPYETPLGVRNSPVSHKFDTRQQLTPSSQIGEGESAMIDSNYKSSRMSFNMDLTQPLGVALSMTGRVMHVDNGSQADFAGVLNGYYIIGVGKVAVRSLEEIQNTIRIHKTALKRDAVTVVPSVNRLTVESGNQEGESDEEDFHQQRREERARRLEKRKRKTKEAEPRSRFVLIVLERRDGGVPRLDLPTGNGLRSYYMVV